MIVFLYKFLSDTTSRDWYLIQNTYLAKDNFFHLLPCNLVKFLVRPKVSLYQECTVLPRKVDRTCLFVSWILSLLGVGVSLFDICLFKALLFMMTLGNAIHLHLLQQKYTFLGNYIITLQMGHCNYSYTLCQIHHNSFITNSTVYIADYSNMQ